MHGVSIIKKRHFDLILASKFEDGRSSCLGLVPGHKGRHGLHCVVLQSHDFRWRVRDEAKRCQHARIPVISVVDVGQGVFRDKVSDVLERRNKFRA